MNLKYPEKATWHSRVLTVNNQEERSTVKGVEFECARWIESRREKFSTGSGSFGDQKTITLRSNAIICKSIQPEDTVEYQGFSYSVRAVREARSMAGFNQVEIYIDLAV